MGSSEWFTGMHRHLVINDDEVSTLPWDADLNFLSMCVNISQDLHGHVGTVAELQALFGCILIVYPPFKDCQYLVGKGLNTRFGFNNAV
jgi:hypothetical protein